MIKGTRLLAAFGLAASLGACGDDSTPGDTTQPDAETSQPDAETSQPDAETTQPDAETTQPDAETTQPDGETSQPETTPDAEVTPTECTGTATTVTGVPFFQFSEDFETNFFGVGGPDTQLQMEFFAGVLSGPGDYELGSNEDDQNYGTCSTCALLTIGEQAFFATDRKSVV